MKEFFLGILKNVITYVLMIIIVIVGGISITTQKFPPNWKQIQSAVETLKTAYTSMISLRQLAMPQMSQGLQLPSTEEIIGAAAGTKSTAATQPVETADLETKTAMALIQSMQAQMNQQAVQRQPVVAPAGWSPEIKNYLQTIEKQNTDMITRMDKIQIYLGGLHQYFAQMQQLQQLQQQQQPPPTAQPTQAPSQQQPQAQQPVTAARQVASPNQTTVTPATATAQPYKK